MKKSFLTLLAVATLSLSALGQTNTPPATDTNLPPTLPGWVNTWLNFLGNTGTNWLVAPYGIFVDDDVNSYGAGIGAFYKISDYALTGMRLDYVADELAMPSINAQLQIPIRAFNKVTVTPFVVSGLATPLGGRGEDNGQVVGIIGSGLAVGVTKNLGVVYDVEKWTSFNGLQHRFGFYWKF